MQKQTVAHLESIILVYYKDLFIMYKKKQFKCFLNELHIVYKMLNNHKIGKMQKPECNFKNCIKHGITFNFYLLETGILDLPVAEDLELVSTKRHTISYHTSCQPTVEHANCVLTIHLQNQNNKGWL